MSNAAALAPLPTRRDEAWRYADIDALTPVWPNVAEPEQWDVAAGEQRAEQIMLTGDSEGAAVRRIHVTLDEGARLELGALVAPSKSESSTYARLELSVDIASGAHFELGGAILGSGDQRLEIVTHTNHHAPDATSNQTIRNVLGGSASGSFLGKILIARDAQRIDAEQSVKSLLLSRKASANAVPQLEIYADDVKCAHGATVGELDENALFYMGARGIALETARQMQIRAFIAEAFVELSGERAEGLLEAALDHLPCADMLAGEGT